MPRDSRQAGFSFLELLIVVVMIMIVVGFAVPTYTTAMRNYRIAGDARSIKGEILLAKMRAAARFTWARVRFNFDSRVFETELWNKTANAWERVDIGAPQVLSANVNFGFGSMASPPPATQATLAQSPGCTEGLAGTPDQPGKGAAIADTACIMFNSRGFPVDGDGNLTPNNAIYMVSENMAAGVTVSLNSVAKIWQGDFSDTDYWLLRQ